MSRLAVVGGKVQQLKPQVAERTAVCADGNVVVLIVSTKAEATAFARFLADPPDKETQMRDRRGVPDTCIVCRDFGRLKLRIVRVKEGPDRGGARGKVFRACCAIIAALERSDPCSAHRKTLRIARGIAEDLATLADEAKPKRR